MNSASTHFATGISMAPTSSMDVDLPTQLPSPTQLVATPCNIALTIYDNKVDTMR